MERLKAVLADKILDISSGSNDDMKDRLDKVQRFRDFAYACQALMSKYPAIEDELSEMVSNDNFDTKEASTRVDKVIRLADTAAGFQEGSVDTDTIDTESVLSPENDSAGFDEEENMFPSREELAAARRKVNIRRIVQLLVVIFIVVILIIIIKFVVFHWQTILIILGFVAVLALLVVWFVKRERD